MEYVSRGATISKDEKYRYLLWREWRGTHAHRNWHWYGAKDGSGRELGEPKACVFIMLNPSTADGETDDPTIRRCVSFAANLNFELLQVVNLFAYRATDPASLLALSHRDDPVGVRNQDFVYDATARAGLVICAWGAHGSHLGQDETVLGWMPTSAKLYRLGTPTKGGQPRHPLYLAGTTPLELMEG